MLEIKVLGTGCKNCIRLTEEAKVAVQELDIEAKITKVETMPEIMKYGIMRTPGLVINEKVKSYGRIPKREEIISYIKEEIQ